MTNLCIADWDAFADDVARSGGLRTHCSLMLLGQPTLCLYLFVDLLFLCDEIICVFLCLGGT